MSAYRESLKFTRPHIYRDCDSIDAAMFSGDTFHERANRDALRVWIARWTRELDARDADPDGEE